MLLRDERGFKAKVGTFSFGAGCLVMDTVSVDEQ